MLLRLADAFQGLGLERLQARSLADWVGYIGGVYDFYVVKLMNHSPVITILMGGMLRYVQHSQMDGLWHCFNNINDFNGSQALNMEVFGS